MNMNGAIVPMAKYESGQDATLSHYLVAVHILTNSDDVPTGLNCQVIKAKCLTLRDVIF